MRSDPAAEAERARYVQGMFGRIAARYDVMNRLMTGGQDQRWRQDAVRRLAPPPGGRLLDLGCGTGDLAREALRQYPGSRVTAGDFTLPMMLVGKNHPGRLLNWAGTDALRLPFPNNTFDGLVSGYLLRNVTNLSQALAEQYRVLKPGGRIVSLDTTRPLPSPLLPFIRLHMRYVIPALGALLTGQRDAYTYLPDTSEHFLTAEELAERIQQAGFREVGFERRMIGTMAIHWARK